MSLGLGPIAAAAIAALPASPLAAGATGALTFYLVDHTASPLGYSSHGSMQGGGTAPAVATTTTAWTIDSTVAAGNSSVMVYGSTQGTGTFGATPQPSAAPSLTGCFRSLNALNGTLANEPWTIALALTSSAAVTASVVPRLRIWYSADPQGQTGVTEITTTTTVLSAASWFAQSGTRYTSATVTLASAVPAGQYLFFEWALQTVGVASGSTTISIVQDGANSYVTTAGFTAATTSAFVQITDLQFGGRMFTAAQAVGNVNLVLVGGTGIAGHVSVTDTAGNTYSQLTSVTSGGGTDVVLMVATGIAAQTPYQNAVTATASAGTVYGWSGFEYQPGVGTSVASATNSGSGTALSTGSVTTSGSTAAFAAFSWDNTTSTASALTSGYVEQAPSVDTTHHVDRVYAAATGLSGGAQSASLTLNATATWCAALVTFAIPDGFIDYAGVASPPPISRYPHTAAKNDGYQPLNAFSGVAALRNFQNWADGDAPRSLPRSRLRIDPEPWEPSPPQPAEFEGWTVEPVRGDPVRKSPPWEADAWESSSPQLTVFQTWLVDTQRGKALRRPPPGETESWEPSPPQPARFFGWMVDSVHGSAARKPPPWEGDAWVSASPAATEYVEWHLPLLVGRASRKAPSWELEAWEPSPPQPAAYQSWTNEARGPRALRVDQDAGYTPADAVTAALLNFGTWTNDLAFALRARRPEPDAWEASPPSPSAFTWWSHEPARGAPTRRVPPWEGEAWEPSPPQIAAFQSWLVESLRGAPARRAQPWEGDAWVASSPQAAQFEAWAIDAARGAPMRRPPPWEGDAWTPTSPQATRYLEWVVAALVGEPLRRRPPWEADAWLSASPEISVFQAWLVEALRGAPARRPPPGETENWEPSPPQPAAYQTWAIDAIRGRPARRPPPWEGEAWVSASPQATEYLDWLVLHATGRASRRAGSWELEAWVPAPPQPAEYEAWAVDVARGAAMRRPPPWETDAWEPSSPEVARFQTWTVDTAARVVGKGPRRAPPWEGEAWEPSPPQPAGYQSWTNEAAGKRYPAPPIEAPFTANPVASIAPTSFVPWTNDTVPPRYVCRPPDPYVGTSIGWAPTLFLGWTVELAPRGAPARRPPPWEGDAWVPTSPEVARFQTWSVDIARGARGRLAQDREPWVGLGAAPADFQLWTNDVATARTARRLAEAPAEAWARQAGFVEWAAHPPGLPRPRAVLVETPFLGVALEMSSMLNWADELRIARGRSRSEPEAAPLAPMPQPSSPWGWADEPRMARSRVRLETPDALPFAAQPGAAPYLAWALDLPLARPARPAADTETPGPRLPPPPPGAAFFEYASPPKLPAARRLRIDLLEWTGLPVFPLRLDLAILVFGPSLAKMRVPTGPTADERAPRAQQIIILRPPIHALRTWSSDPLTKGAKAPNAASIICLRSWSSS